MINKILIGSIIANILLAIFAFKSISSLSMKMGALEVQIVSEKSKTERYKTLYEAEHDLIMENKLIDQKIKQRIQDALDIIIRAYDGTINPN